MKLRNMLEIAFIVAVIAVAVAQFCKTHGLTFPEHWGEHPCAAGY